MVRPYVCLLIIFLDVYVFAQDTGLPRVPGEVKKIDLEVGTITIRPSRKGATEDEVFNFFKKNITVKTSDGQIAQLKDIAPGQMVHLEVRPTGDVEAVVVQPRMLVTTILEVDPARRTITIPTDGNATATLAVDAKAEVLLGSRSVYLGEVKLGSRMNLTISVDGKKALALQLVSDPDGKYATKLFQRVKTSRLLGAPIMGLLEPLNLAKNEFQITGLKTKGVPKTFVFTPGAEFSMMHNQVLLRPLSIKQVTGPVQATIAYSSGEQKATRALIQAPTLQARVKHLDADQGKLRVVVEGKEAVYDLRWELKVMDKGKVMRWSDVQPGMVVTLAFSLDRKELLAIDIRKEA